MNCFQPKTRMNRTVRKKATCGKCGETSSPTRSSVSSVDSVAQYRRNIHSGIAIVLALIYCHAEHVNAQIQPLSHSQQQQHHHHTQIPLAPFVPLSHRPLSIQNIVNPSTPNTIRRSQHDNRNDTQLLGFDGLNSVFTPTVGSNNFSSTFSSDSFGAQLPSQFYFPPPPPPPFYPSFVGNGQDNAFSASSIIPSTFPVNDFSSSSGTDFGSLTQNSDAGNKIVHASSSNVNKQLKTSLGSVSGNSTNSKQIKTSFGRRFGELMTNSAKALKQFSQFNSKLLNDIKPSKLLGLTSSSSNNDHHAAASSNKVTIVKPDQHASASSMTSSVYPSNWYPPNPAAQQWPQTMNSMPTYYQQPVFVRTQDLPVANAALSPLSSSSKMMNNNGDLSAFESMFHPSKLPLDGPSMYSPLIKTTPNRQKSHSSMGSSTTTVYHHYPKKQPIQDMNNNGQDSDLFTASQTYHGMRVKAPKDYEDTSDDDMSSGEQNDEPDHENDNDSDRPGAGWANNVDGQSNTIDPEIFSQLEQASRHRPRTGWNQDFPAGRPSSSESRYRYGQKMRTKTPSFPEFDDSNSDWYNTFLGANTKSIPPTRFVHPSLLQNPAMSSFYGTRFGQQKSMEASSYFPSFSRPAAATAAMTPNYGSMYSGMFAPSHAQAYFRPPMMASASSMRPVTMAASYYQPAHNYLMPRFPRAGPSMFNYGYPISGMAYQPTAFMPGTPTNNPYTMAVRGPPASAFAAGFNPMMAAASMSYPVRVAPPHMSPGMGQPAIAHGMMPMAPAFFPSSFAAPSPFGLRPAFPAAAYPGSGLFPARRSMNITRRQDNGGSSGDGSSSADQTLSKRSDETTPSSKHNHTAIDNSDKNNTNQNTTYYYYFTDGHAHNRTTVPTIVTPSVNTYPTATALPTTVLPAYSVTPTINAKLDNNTAINKQTQQYSQLQYSQPDTNDEDGDHYETAEDIRRFLHIPAIQHSYSRSGKANPIQAKLSDWSPVLKRH